MAWNRSNGRVGSSASPKSKSSSVRGVVAGLGLLVIATAATWLVLRGDARGTGAEPSVQRPRKADTASTLPPRTPTAPHKAATKTATNAAIASSPSQTASHVEQAPRVSETNDANIPEDTRTFKNPMDQLLSMVVPRNAGDAIPPVPITDDMEFSEDDERKILERMTADDQDSEAVLERKELVQSLRDEYFELKKRGWTFVEYIRALEAKANLDSDVLEESQRIHETIFNDSSISDEVYAKTLETINKMLADRGIKPIHPPQDEPDADNNEGKKE